VRGRDVALQDGASAAVSQNESGAARDRSQVDLQIATTSLQPDRQRRHHLLERDWELLPHWAAFDRPDLTELQSSR
jgi:hypothetical protein